MNENASESLPFESPDEETRRLREENARLLVEVARKNRNPAVRKQAMFGLGQSNERARCYSSKKCLPSEAVNVCPSRNYSRSALVLGNSPCSQFVNSNAQKYCRKVGHATYWHVVQHTAGTGARGDVRRMRKWPRASDNGRTPSSGAATAAVKLAPVRSV